MLMFVFPEENEKIDRATFEHFFKRLKERGLVGEIEAESKEDAATAFFRNAVVWLIPTHFSNRFSRFLFSVIQGNGILRSWKILKKPMFSFEEMKVIRALRENKDIGWHLEKLNNIESTVFLHSVQRLYYRKMLHIEAISVI